MMVGVLVEMHFAYNYHFSSVKQSLQVAHQQCKVMCKPKSGGKRTLTNFSELPRHLEATEEAEMLKKVVLHSVATARASRVLPVPGGPYSRMPCTTQGSAVTQHWHCIDLSSCKKNVQPASPATGNVVNIGRPAFDFVYEL